MMRNSMSEGSWSSTGDASVLSDTAQAPHMLKLQRVAKRSPPRLRPGATLEFRFPELPPTVWSRFYKRRRVTALRVGLPENYDVNRTFPLLVYMSGWEGSDGGANIDYVRTLCGNRDFITVAMPLFKKDLDPAEYIHGLLVSAFDDYPIIARCHRRMLSRVLAAIPNIEPGAGALGGFSNGAHTTAMLLSALDPFVLKHFRDFYLLDGGGWLTSLHKDRMRDKRILYMVGGSRREPYRRHWLDSVRSVCFVGRMRKRDVTCIVMPGVGHALPEKHIPQLRAWLKREGPGVRR
jgi:hypothetical protein